MSVDVVTEPDSQIPLGAGKTIGASANGTSSPERSVLLMSRLKAFWRLLNLPCQGMCRLASDSLDHDLGHPGALRCGRICSTAPVAAASNARSGSCGSPCSGCQGTSRTDGHCPVRICRTKYASASACPQSEIGKLKVCPIDSRAVAVRNWTAERLNFADLIRHQPFGGFARTVRVNGRTVPLAFSPAGA